MMKNVQFLEGCRGDRENHARNAMRLRMDVVFTSLG